MNYIRAGFTCFSGKIILPTIGMCCCFCKSTSERSFFHPHLNVQYLDIEVGQRIIPGIFRVEILHPEKYLNYMKYRTQYNIFVILFLFLIPVWLWAVHFVLFIHPSVTAKAWLLYLALFAHPLMVWSNCFKWHHSSIHNWLAYIIFLA